MKLRFFAYLGVVALFTKGTLPQRLTQVSEASFNLADSSTEDQDVFEKVGMALFLASIGCEAVRYVFSGDFQTNMETLNNTN